MKIIRWLAYTTNILEHKQDLVHWLWQQGWTFHTVRTIRNLDNDEPVVYWIIAYRPHA